MCCLYFSKTCSCKRQKAISRKPFFLYFLCSKIKHLFRMATINDLPSEVLFVLVSFLSFRTACLVERTARFLKAAVERQRRFLPVPTSDITISIEDERNRTASIKFVTYPTPGARLPRPKFIRIFPIGKLKFILIFIVNLRQPPSTFAPLFLYAFRRHYHYKTYL